MLVVVKTAIIFITTTTKNKTAATTVRTTTTMTTSSSSTSVSLVFLCLFSVRFAYFIIGSSAVQQVHRHITLDQETNPLF
jgi:hypothetical protein